MHHDLTVAVDSAGLDVLAVRALNDAVYEGAAAHILLQISYFACFASVFDAAYFAVDVQITREIGFGYVLKTHVVVSSHKGYLAALLIE